MIEQQSDRSIEPLEDERSEELEELQTAAQLLLDTAGTQKWSPRELQSRARNGHRRDVVSLAFWQLVNEGTLLLDADLQVRRAGRR
jgi:hypothetical protein